MSWRSKRKSRRCLFRDDFSVLSDEATPRDNHMSSYNLCWMTFKPLAKFRQNDEFGWKVYIAWQLNSVLRLQRLKIILLNIAFISRDTFISSDNFTPNGAFTSRSSQETRLYRVTISHRMVHLHRAHLERYVNVEGQMNLAWQACLFVCG